MATIFAANRSNVQIDGELIEGLQSIVYRVVTEREDIRAVGSSERIDVSFGLRTVQGELAVKSANYVLDKHLTDQSKTQLVVNLKKDQAADAPKRTLSFDNCYIEGKSFGMDAGGSAITTYLFTASLVREE
ncbi:MAG: hypothetical protein WAX77_03835 [Methylococcaceae bacterium]